MAVICGGDVYINNMTETFPVLEKVARFSKLSATNVFFFHSFGKTHAWDIFSTWIICEKCFLNFYCFKQFFFKNIFRTLVAFFKLLFGCPTTNVWPLLNGQPPSPDVNHCVFAILTWMSREPWKRLGPWTPPSTFGVWTSNPPILMATPYPTRVSCTIVVLYYELIVCVCVSFLYVWLKILDFSSLAQA